MDKEIVADTDKDLGVVLDIVFLMYSVYQAYEKLMKILKRKTFWVRDEFLDREVSGFYATTFNKLKRDKEQFRATTRMDPETFDFLLNLLRDKLEKNSIRTPIPPDCRLFLTLVYLANGCTRQFLSTSFKMSCTVIRTITMDTCKLIFEELSHFYIETPNESEWKKIAKNNANAWNLPNCVGAVEEKCITLRRPTKFAISGLAILGACDANYSFTAFEVGTFGSQYYGTYPVYSTFGKKFLRGELNLPPNANLPNTDVTFPHYFVGDDGFPLKSFLMKPYSGTALDEERENYNKQLSRAQRTIENAFGVLAARWKIVEGTTKLSQKTFEAQFNAAIVLHNFLIVKEETYCPPEYVDREENGVIIQGLWRQEIDGLPRMNPILSRNSENLAFEQRDFLNEYLFAIV